MTRCTASSCGTAASIVRRNCRNSILRWRRCSSPMTSPVAMSSAANNVVVPMGFGGGAMIGAPLADRLMKLFATPTSVGVWQTFLVLGAGYSIYMIAGSLGYRLPAEGWKPKGWEPAAGKALVTTRNVHLSVASRTPQFWLLWG